MGTKKIAEALGMLNAVSGSGIIKQAVDDARAELEAIRKAAHMVAVVGQSEAHVDRYEEWKAACEFLRSIAKEGP